jgi:prepilin signal peptidase PulO-like enzyme (type II secretory pathway)
MLYYLGLIAAAAFGAIFGSYGTLFTYRLPRNESCFGRYFGPKSRCPKCGTIIRTRELIPIFNWLFTRGKCRICQAQIPLIYLAIEISTALLFTLCYIRFGFGEYFIIFAIFCAACVVLLAIDYSWQIWSNLILNAALICAISARLLQDGQIFDLIISAAFGVVAATIFYEIFHKKCQNFLPNQARAFGFAQFIIIVSIIFSLPLFICYFSLILLIFALTFISSKDKEIGKDAGFALVLPSLFLIFNPFI